MKLPLILGSLALFATFTPLTGEEKEAEIEGMLRFPNGDSLRGKPAGIDSEGLLEWSSELFQQESERFRIQTADAILFEPSNDALATADSSSLATITFQNKIDKSVDTLEAELLGFDEESVRVKTWFAGELTLKRSMLNKIEVDGQAGPLVQGPGSINDWRTLESATAWKIEGDTIISTNRGSLVREFSRLPDKIQVSFRLEYESSPYLRVEFFANSGTELMPSQAYSLNLQRGPINFLKRSDGRSMQLETDMAGLQHQFPAGNAASIDIYADRENGLFALFIDGKQVCVARDQNPIAEGDWLHLNSLNSRVQSLHEFAIRPWDGELPEEDSLLDTREELEGEGEQIELQNGDTILGQVTVIEDGKLKIETEYMPIAIPIERLKSFQITSYENREEPIISAADVRAYFTTGGFVTLKLSEMTPTSISGHSQVFGDATFDLRAFSHIHFNVYDEDFRKRRGEPL